MELTLRESYRHTANVEARLAMADSSNDTLRAQLQETSQDLFHQRRDLQRLEVTIELERERHSNAISLVASTQLELNNTASSAADDQARLVQLEGLVGEIESLRSTIVHIESERAGAFVSFAEVEAHAQAVHAQLNDSLSKADVLQEQLNDSLGNAHHWYLQAIEREKRLHAVLESTSWRVTGPVRLVVTTIYKTVKFPALTVKKVARGVANRLVTFVIARPKLAVKLGNVSRKMPKVHARLSRIARAEDHSSSPVDIGPKNAAAELAVVSVSQSGQQPVTHRASAIYHALESSVESKVKH
jgi:O-antigen chain-terminating methyltransferase